MSSGLRPHGAAELPPLDHFTAAKQKQRTTEHILPQNPDPDDACWWEHFSREQHADLVHSLGNLALTYDNSSYSNKCFVKKRGLPLSPGEQPYRCYAQADLRQERDLAAVRGMDSTSGGRAPG